MIIIPIVTSSKPSKSPEQLAREAAEVRFHSHAEQEAFRQGASWERGEEAPPAWFFLALVWFILQGGAFLAGMVEGPSWRHFPPTKEQIASYEAERAAWVKRKAAATAEEKAAQEKARKEMAARFAYSSSAPLAPSSAQFFGPSYPSGDSRRSCLQRGRWVWAFPAFPVGCTLRVFLDAKEER